MKKAFALWLALSLLGAAGSLWAKVRRGAEVIVFMKDGSNVTGELIAVKPTSLLLVESESGRDSSVDLGEVFRVTVKRESRAKQGLVSGLLIGGCLGAVQALASGLKEEGDTTSNMTAAAVLSPIPILIFGAVGALVGAGIGEAAGQDKEFPIHGRDEGAISETLKSLRAEARYPDFPQTRR